MSAVKMQKGVFAVLLVLVLAVFTVLAGCSSESTSEKYNAGTYTGEGQGKGGPIVVTLTFDGSSIASVDEITGDDETKTRDGYASIQDGTFASQIMDAQSADIDGVSGATLTSNGVRDAVQDCIDQATK